MIFKPITREEFLRMSLDERMAYLHRLLTDLRQKLEETRQEHKAMSEKHRKS